MNNESKEKAKKISAEILARVVAGENIRAAIDQVLGKGTSESLIADLYEALRAKAS
jgi:hypothetical protein